MILKPAVLECARCGKIFIGYARDVMPRGGPKCLKCTAREAWDLAANALGPAKRRPAAAKKRRGATKPDARRPARKKAPGKGRGGRR